MKPPWKYLARLVSRQRSSETPDESSSLETAGKPAEVELRPTATVLLSFPGTALRDAEQDESSAEDRVTAPAAIDREAKFEEPANPPDSTEAAKAEANETYSDSSTLRQRPTDESPVRMSKLRRARSKNAKKDPIGPNIVPVTTPNTPVPATPRPGDSFFDNAKSLDDDIKQLRDLLAQKLRIQNAQLREMLERFERS